MHKSHAAAIKAGDLAIVTIVDTAVPMVQTSDNWAITVPRFLANTKYHKFANVVLEYDAKYAGRRYAFWYVASDDDDDDDDDYDASSDMLYDDCINFPIITTIHSLVREISVLRRVYGRWETVNTTVMDISQLNLHPFITLKKRNFLISNPITIVLTSAKHDNRKHVHSAAGIIPLVNSINPSETLYIISTLNNGPLSRVDARHLGMLAKTGLITHEYAAAHLYEPAAEKNITYDDKINDN